jgi:hypothetical protein
MTTEYAGGRRFGEGCSRRPSWASRVQIQTGCGELLNSLQDFAKSAILMCLLRCPRNFRFRAVESHISRNTSEMWGTLGPWPGHEEGPTTNSPTLGAA